MRGWGLLVLSLHVLSCLVSGVASGRTSSYVRTEFPSTDIPLDSEWFAIPKGYNAPQQVHITQGDYDGKAIIVSWVTPEEPGPSEVFYGKEKQYDQKAEGTTTNYTFYDYKSGYIHHCLVDGLEYNTKYYYKIGSGDSAREFWFETPPAIDPDASYTFGIIGDLGQTFNSLSTLQHYEKTGGQTVLFVGDLSYADRYEHNDGIRWDSWGRFVESSTAYQPWIWNAGNHEIEYRPDLGETSTFKPYLHRYMTPYLASKSSSPMWYAVRRASAHIIVLSSYSPFGTLDEPREGRDVGAKPEDSV
ncbi:phosphoenolpyruvate phosphatase-like isoform X2 [Miscanthus floridulus]|uniref:phosphoenolpyruvate phosphatase-like isoform X2 n=1 Tax=Miscanthus floridulus TaxID=154761 RepID=UPI0034574DCA